MITLLSQLFITISFIFHISDFIETHIFHSPNSTGYPHETGVLSR